MDHRSSSPSIGVRHCLLACLILTLSSTSKKASWSHNRRTLEAQPEEAGWIERWLRRSLKNISLGCNPAPPITQWLASPLEGILPSCFPAFSPRSPGTHLPSVMDCGFLHPQHLHLRRAVNSHKEKQQWSLGLASSSHSP